MPRFSIIIPEISSPADKCIASLVSQTYTDFEVLVSGLSDSDIQEIRNTFSQKNPINIISEPNPGSPSEAIERCIRKASGTYLYILNSRHSLHPQTLEIVNEYLNRYQDDILITGYRTVRPEDEDRIEINRSFVYHEPWSGKSFVNYCAAEHSFFLRKKLFKDKRLKHVRFDDPVLMPIFALPAKKIGKINARLLQCRQDPSTLTDESVSSERISEIISSCDDLLTAFRNFKKTEFYRTELEFHLIRAVLFREIPRIFSVSKDTAKAEILYDYIKKTIPDFCNNSNIQTRIKRNRMESLIISGDWESLWNEFFESPVVQTMHYLEKQKDDSAKAGDILISIIVPVYNVEAFLPDCLRSIRDSIKNIPAEVIMINDGATDQSGTIARLFSEKFSNFLYHEQENQGLSAARNAGAALARGKYIAFADSDDAVYESMYTNLLKAAERDQSDMAFCLAAAGHHLNAETWNSDLMNKLQAGLPAGAMHITTTPQLVYDVYAWNKLIRRDFYLKHQFQFPRGKLYEDMSVSIRLHLLAKRVSYVPEYLYFYRIRCSDNKSITQRPTDRNLCQQIEMMERTIREAKDNHCPDLVLNALKDKLINSDFNLLAGADQLSQRDHPDAFLEVMEGFVQRNLSEDDIGRQSVIIQKKIRAFLNRDADLLYKICLFQRRHLKNMPCSIENGKAWRCLPAELFGTEKEPYFSGPVRTGPETGLISVSGELGHAECRAYLYYPGIPVSVKDTRNYRVYAEDAIRGKSIPLPVVLPDGTKDMEQRSKVYSGYDGSETVYDYSGCVFQFAVHAEEIIPFLAEASSQILLRVEYETPYDSGTVYLRNPIKKEMFLFYDDESVIRIVESPGKLIGLEIIPAEKEELISLIIPVYNAAGFLPGIIRMINEQTHKNMEILFVDDGSTDDSPKMLDSYAEADARIKVYHLQHCGVAKARNYALRRYTGSYVMFADADDLFCKNYVKRLYMLLRENHVHAAACNAHDSRKTDIREYDYREIKKSYIVNSKRIDYRTRTSHRVVWGAIYDRYAVYNIFFDEQYQVSTDTLFFARVADRVGNYLQTEEELYCYMIYNDSLSHRQFDRIKYDDIRVWHRIYRLHPETTLSKDSSLLVILYKTKDTLIYLMKSGNTDFGLYRQIFKDIKSLGKAPLALLFRKETLKNRLSRLFPGVYQLLIRLKTLLHR